MATQLKAVSDLKPVPMGAALYALSTLSDAVKHAIPEAKSVTVELTEAHTLRLVIKLGSLAYPAETVFVLRRDLIPGYRFDAIDTTRENGSFGRHIITANVKII